MTTIFGSGSPAPENFALNQISAGAITYSTAIPPENSVRFNEDDSVSISIEALSIAAQNEPQRENSTVDGGIGDNPVPPDDPDS